MKGLNKQVFDVTSNPMSWMEEDKYALAHQDEIRATTKIILHLIAFMEKHQMSQTDLAQQLGVTPQYVNKLLHGQDTSFRIDTAILYGKKLGIKLVDIPEIDSSPVQMFELMDELCEIVSGQFRPHCFVNTPLLTSVNFNRKQIWKQEKALAIA